MLYLSLDLETTGLAPKQPDRILQIALVAEDTNHKEIPVEDLPYWSGIIIPTGEVSGQMTALAMNSWIFVAIEMYKSKMALSDLKKRYRELGIPQETIDRAVLAYSSASNIDTLPEIIKQANLWIDKHFGTRSHINIAGKNVAGFDMPFLPKELTYRFRHRCIDPGSVLIDWSKDRLLSGEDIAKKLNIQSVTHNALDDARDVIRWLRTTY